VAKLGQPHLPALIRLGQKSTLLPLMKRLLPTAWLDRILMKRFHLDRLV
jgi:hypothetical protein